MLLHHQANRDPAAQRPRLGCHVGQTSKDGKVTLRTAECLASCGTAPMMQVDKAYHENLTVEKVDKILDGLLR